MSQRNHSSDPTSSAAGSPVRTSVSRAKGPDSPAPGLDCGTKCSALFGHHDPDGCWLRMYLRCELAGRTRYLMTWKERATPVGRSWWVLSMSARPIDGTGSSSSDTWQTPTSADGGSTSRGGDRKGELLLGGQARTWYTPNTDDRPSKNQDRNLAVQAAAYPTPRASDGRPKGRAGGRMASLETAALDRWFTPNARDWKDTGPTQGNRKDVNLGVQVHQARGAGPPDPANPSTSGKPRDWSTPTVGQMDGGSNSRKAAQRDGRYLGSNAKGSLNPAWVTALMGFPDGWLDLPAETLSALSATPSSRKSPK